METRSSEPQTSKNSKPRDVYQTVTDRILELLDQGVAPWRHPIKRRAGEDGFPKSLATGKAYRGINVFLLAATSWIEGYESNYWLTFNQSRKQGGQVRKGEKATLVIFWKQHAFQDQESGEERCLPVLRHYHVFNADQVEGLAAPDAVVVDDSEPFESITAAEEIVANFPNRPKIEQTGSQACYLPSIDTVRIASPERFESGESFYATLFHELVHASGHSTRLNREIGNSPSVFGSPDYGQEELVAEIGSAFLAATAGISPPTIEQAVAYIDGWRKRLQADKKLIVRASGQAQRAADHILGVTFE